MHTNAADYPSWTMQSQSSDKVAPEGKSQKAENKGSYLVITKEMVERAEKEEFNIEYKYIVRYKVCSSILLFCTWIYFDKYCQI